ncbi:MAG: RodZ domain-containing protein [Pseudomonadota bacterium]
MENEQEGAVQELPLMGAGDHLRAAREEQKLELEHVSAQTRIPIRHLEVIEAGDFDSLPSRAYAIGFSRTYATAMGLDADEVVDLVRTDMAESRTYRAVMAGEMEPGDPAKLPSAGLAWFGGFAALILAVGLVAFFTDYFAAGTGPAPLVAEADRAEAGTSELALGEDGSANGGASVAAMPTSSGQVVFTALEDGIWVRFYEDGGERLFESQMATGDRFELPVGASEPRINTGRPDAFAITIDGQTVPKLSEEPVTIGGAPVSAAALLARADAMSSRPGAPSNGAAPTPN